MPIIKKLTPADMQELRDHRDNTAWEMIKCYTLSELSYMDWVDTRTIKQSWRYFPVRVDTWMALYKFKKGENKKPYLNLRIRLDEIKDLYSKRNKGKKLTSI